MINSCYIAFFIYSSTWLEMGHSEGNMGQCVQGIHLIFLNDITLNRDITKIKGKNMYQIFPIMNLYKNFQTFVQ